jgi:hypothetical protein
MAERRKGKVVDWRKIELPLPDIIKYVLAEVVATTLSIDLGVCD